MKTIKQAAYEYSIDNSFIGKERIPNDAFIACSEFANRWIQISEEKPKYYDSALVKFENGEILLVWRSWSESRGSDVYTICGTNIIVDSKPIEWNPINIEIAWKQ